jgi:hypothetical protein
MTLLILLAVLLDFEESSVSLELEELEESDDVEDPIISASTPGCDSSSMTC